MVTDTQMKGRHPVKLHTEGVLTGPDLSEIQSRRILMNKQVPAVYLQTEHSPVGTSSGFSHGNILLPDPPKCRKNGKDFYFKDAPGLHSISPFSYFSPCSTITGFQSCCSVRGICVCNGEVAGLSDQDGKDWAISSKAVSLSYLISSYLSAASSASADPCLYSIFLQINPFSLPVHSPSTSPSFPWSLKTDRSSSEPLDCP